MEKRETDLLKNDRFLAFLYLDPRYKVFISEIDQIVATQHLQQTWDRLKLLQQEVASDLFGTESDSSETPSAHDDLDILIEAREKAAQKRRQSFTSVIFTSNNAMQRNLIMVLLTVYTHVYVDLMYTSIGILRQRIALLQVLLVYKSTTLF